MSKERKSRQDFGMEIARYVKEDPESAPILVEACQLGIRAALREARERSYDMETALLASLMTKRNAARGNPGELILEKLAKWYNKCCFNWDWYFESQEVDPKEKQNDVVSVDSES
jgi:hypothetical protein